MKNKKPECKNEKKAVGPAELEDRNGDSVFTLTNAATVMECTGLIQVPPENEDELENYADIYSFSQPEPLPPEKEK